MLALLLLSSLAMAEGPVTLPPVDSEFGCTAQEKAEKYIDDFNINVSSFGGQELCNPEADTKKLFNDLEIIERGEFEGSDTNVFIRNSIPTTAYYPWMKDMTYGVRRGHDIPWATAYNSGGYFTMQDGWAKLSTLGRVGTIIHEARHTAGYRHRPCVRGPYSDTGLSGCDQSVQETGSHGIEMEYYSRVALQGKNFHPVYAAMARMMNLGRANFVFNTMPMQTKEALVALSGLKALIMTDTENAFIFRPEIGEGFVLKRTSFGASLYNGRQAYAMDLYSLAHANRKIEDDFSYYKLIKMPIFTPDVDLQELDQGAKRYLISLDAGGNVRSFVFEEAEWSRPTQINGGKFLSTVAPGGQRGLFVVKVNGGVCSLNVETLRCGADLAQSWPMDVVTYTYFGDRLLSLRRDGVVIDVLKGESFDKLNGIAVEQIVSAPIWDAFKL